MKLQEPPLFRQHTLLHSARMFRLLVFFVSSLPWLWAVEGLKPVLVPPMTSGRDGATKYCQMAGKQYRLPSTQTTPEMSALESLMKMKKWNETWLALKKIKFSAPTWIDGNVLDSDSIRQSPEKSCGFLHARDKSLELGDCVNQMLPYICLQTGCNACPRRPPYHQCVQNGKSCYIVHLGKTSWYAARGHCDRSGGSLAIIDTHLMQNLSSKLLSFDTQHLVYWIGYRLQDWYYDDTEKDGYLWDRGAFWFENEPADGHDCAKMSIRNGLSGWRGAHCEEKLHFRCVVRETFLDKNSSLTNITRGSVDQETGGVSQSLILIIVLSVLGAVIVISLLVFFVFLKKGVIKYHGLSSDDN